MAYAVHICISYTDYIKAETNIKFSGQIVLNGKTRNIILISLNTSFYYENYKYVF